jgi:hypothetical protein
MQNAQPPNSKVPFLERGTRRNHEGEEMGIEGKRGGKGKLNCGEEGKLGEGERKKMGKGKGV